MLSGGGVLSVAGVITVGAPTGVASEGGVNVKTAVARVLRLPVPTIHTAVAPGCATCGGMVRVAVKRPCRSVRTRRRARANSSPRLRGCVTVSVTRSFGSQLAPVTCTTVPAQPVVGEITNDGCNAGVAVAVGVGGNGVIVGVCIAAGSLVAEGVAVGGADVAVGVAVSGVGVGVRVAVAAAVAVLVAVNVGVDVLVAVAAVVAVDVLVAVVAGVLVAVGVAVGSDGGTTIVGIVVTVGVGVAVDVGLPVTVVVGVAVGVRVPVGEGVGVRVAVAVVVGVLLAVGDGATGIQPKLISACPLRS